MQGGDRCIVCVWANFSLVFEYQDAFQIKTNICIIFIKRYSNIYASTDVWLGRVLHELPYVSFFLHLSLFGSFSDHQKVSAGW